MNPQKTDRHSFIGGSDARIIMGEDEAALIRLWREKRGEVEFMCSPQIRGRPNDLSFRPRVVGQSSIGRLDASNPVHFPDLPPTGFRSRTPGPPPFSSMNSTPADFPI